MTVKEVMGEKRPDFTTLYYNSSTCTGSSFLIALISKCPGRIRPVHLSQHPLQHQSTSLLLHLKYARENSLEQLNTTDKVKDEIVKSYEYPLASAVTGEEFAGLADLP